MKPQAMPVVIIVEPLCGFNIGLFVRGKYYK